MKLQDRPRKDITGHKYERLTVLKYLGNNMWKCQCVCGNITNVNRQNLKSKQTRSCGCLRSEIFKSIKSTHGHTRNNTKTREFEIWMGMKKRCYNTNSQDYYLYGGRGIKICKRWQSFIYFYADMGDAPSRLHSIGRINNNGNYQPSNCEWVTAKQQARNTRRNRIVNYLGQRMCLIEFAELVGLPYSTTKWRLNAGWPISRTAKEPLRKKAI